MFTLSSLSFIKSQLIRLLLVGLSLIVLVNIYVHYNLNYIPVALKTVTESEKNKTHEQFEVDEFFCLVGNATNMAHRKILNEVSSTKNLYKPSPISVKYFDDMLKLLKQGLNNDFNNSFTMHRWVALISSSVATSEDYISVGSFLNMLQIKGIKKAENAVKGTQLKLLLSLEDDLQVVFKPKWYPYDYIVHGTVYSGKDRHFAEMVAFYLSFILNLPRVPPAVTRNINLKTEILPVADEKLMKTFSKQGNNSCFYGICFYCKWNDTVCADGDILEGVVTYYLSQKYKLSVVKHPWKRTYNCKKLSKWETDNNYCDSVKTSEFFTNKQNKHVLLDLIEISIFDFLIDNGDRHHFEYFKRMPTPRILIIDNGKSFGNPYKDHIEILAPLYQCCILRKSTWEHLLRVNNGNLSKWLRYLLEGNKLNFRLYEDHYQAIERRLSLVFAAIIVCIKEKGGLHNFLVE